MANIYDMFRDVRGLEPRNNGKPKDGPRDSKSDDAYNPRRPKGGPAPAYFKNAAAA